MYLADSRTVNISTYFITVFHVATVGMGCRSVLDSAANGE
jgi:hypothetical protein